MLALFKICFLLALSNGSCAFKAEVKPPAPPIIIPAVNERLDGYASQYSPGVMEATVNYHQTISKKLPLDTNKWDGFIAVLHCHLIGRTVLVEEAWFEGRLVARDEYMLVSDCANLEESPHLVEWMRYVPMEVGGATAARWGIVGRGDVTVKARLLPE